MGGAPVQALTVLADQGGTLPSCTQSQVDAAGRARHQRDQGRLVALPDDPQNPMAPLEGHVLKVGPPGFTHPKTVQPQ